MGFFNRLFSKEKQLDPIDLGLVGTDMHSHLIPGIDDGSKSIEESLELLEKFAELGYRKVITTPHVMSDFYRNTPETILGGLATVKAALAERQIPIEIEAAAEYYLDFHFSDLIARKELLTFGNNHVLFELSFTAEQPNVNQVVFDMITEGYRPILAHVERYPFYFNNWEKIEDYRNRGVLLQLNINSLSGHYGPQVKRMAESLIERDWIDVIGSDCHHAGHLQLMNDVRTNPFLHRIVNKENLLNKQL